MNPLHAPGWPAVAMRRCFALALCVALAGCSAPADDYPWLDTLDADDAKAHGERLMALPLGLHRLDRGATPAAPTVAIHGWRSAGYEWVYLLQTLGSVANGAASTWFFRWDWSLCPEAGAAELAAALAAAGLDDSPGIRAIGHSLGGVLVASAAASWQAPAQLEAHAIAAPLAGLPDGDRSPACSYRPPAALPDNVVLHQWRTQHALDGAFKDWPTDPQVVAIPGPVTRLPATYRGHRLGHNWSLSWVADKLAGTEPPP